MSWFDRLRSQTAVNYNEESEEEDLEEGLNFDNFESPLESPSRPVHTREGSPQDLAHPTLNDNVDEELAQVRQTLQNVGHTPLFRGVRTSIFRGVPEGEEASSAADPEISEEVEESGLVVQESQSEVCQEPPENPEVVVMAVFEDENGTDEANALTEAIRRLERYEWNQEDLLFYFGQVEIKMAAAGVKKQFTKFQALSSNLPKQVIEAVKPFLRKTEADYTENNSYKLLKTEILRIFGPKPGAAIERALARVMVGPPSQLARELVNDICKNELNCPCCPAVVEAIWKRHLSAPVKAGIAKYTLSKDNFKEVTELADAIHDSSTPLAASVSAVRVETASLNETQPGLQYPVPEVNAVQSNRGGSRGGNRGNRGSRGRGGRGGRGGTNQTNQTSRPRGTRHPDIPPGDWSGCSNHYRFGKSAYFCSEPASCPWKDIFITRPAK